MTPPNPKPVQSVDGARSKQVLIVASMACVLFLALAFIGYRWMQNEALAVLVDFSGQPERDTKSTLERWESAEHDDEFNSGDGARTSEDSNALFKLMNGAKLKLKPSSQIRFHKGSGSSELGVDIRVGEVDIESSVGGIAIDSEFGEIVLDANTAVSMSRAGDRLVIGVELGRIQIGESERAVSAGENVEIELGGILVDLETPKAALKAPPEPTASAETQTVPKLEIGDGVELADLNVTAGSSFVVHDPNPPTAVGFAVEGLCESGARLTAGEQKTEALTHAKLRFASGQHTYEVRCLSDLDIVVAKGNVRVLQDAGTRALPSFAPQANVTTDGRRYTVMYQHRLPNVTVSWPSAPVVESYALKIGERTIQTKKPSYTFSSLRRGTHQVVFTAASDPPRQSRTTTVEVVYDTQAPAARVADPPLGFEPGESVKISGQALPGWNVSVGGKKLDVDANQKFSAELESNGALPIEFSHPNRGTHYYLRRPKNAVQ